MIKYVNIYFKNIPQIYMCVCIYLGDFVGEPTEVS